MVSGVFAAMTLPRSAQGSIDMDAFAQHLEFVLDAGIRGFVLNGATGEYCLTSCDELGGMLQQARRVTGDEATLLAGIGGASLAQTMQRLEVAEASGADALLLPMPCFFPYEQQDLISFSSTVSESASLPLLLYNLPRFTTPLEPATVFELVTSSAKIDGIKDSSDELDTVRLLKQSAPQANRVIGNDGVLYAAMLEDLCDGVVSGVASVLPELMQALYAAVQRDPLGDDALAHKAALYGFIQWLDRFPVPWGLKMVAAERGLSPADFALPPSPQRAADAAQFMEWFRANRGCLLAG